MKEIFETGGFPKGDDILLIKAAAKNGAEALQCWQEWSRRHVLETDVTLDRYRVLPFAYEKLSENPAASGLDFPMAVEGAFKKTFFLNSLLLKHFIKTQRQLEERGIPVMLLKGMAMIVSGLYARMGSRFQFDYDILVPFDRREEAVSLFENSGYQPYYEGGREHHLRTSHSVGFSVPDMPAYGSFDLHWVPLALHKHRRTSDLFFNEKKEITFNGHTFHVPPPELLLIQTIVHGLRTDHTSHTQWVCDVIAILENCPALDWEKLAQYSEALQAGFFIKKGMQFMKEVIGLTLPLRAEAVVRNIRHSAAEPYLFSFYNTEKKGVADHFVWKLHESRQLLPEKPLPWHLLQILTSWRQTREDLKTTDFLKLAANRLGQLVKNSTPDYAEKK
jgi:hypothetical protein